MCAGGFFIENTREFTVDKDEQKCIVLSREPLLCASVRTLKRPFWTAQHGGMCSLNFFVVVAPI